MSDTISEPTVLVPVDASDPGEPAEGLVELLSPHQLVVLGYYPVPDQTATEQARTKFGEGATEAIGEIADRFAERGAGAESVVVFTHDRSETIDNAAADYDADAVLTAGPVDESLDRILLPLRGDDNLDRILGFAGGLLRDSDATVTLFNIAESEDTATRGELLVRGARDRLVDEEGIDRDRIDWRQATGTPVTDTIVDVADAYDLIIVGESEPSLTERILGKVTNTIIDQSSEPLLIVRDK